MPVNFLSAERLLASQKGLFYMELAKSFWLTR